MSYGARETGAPYQRESSSVLHMNPALEILHSTDLVNWEHVGYCMNRLDFGPAFRLEGGNIYGRGILGALHPLSQRHLALTCSSFTRNVASK